MHAFFDPADEEFVEFLYKLVNLFILCLASES